MSELASGECQDTLYVEHGRAGLNEAAALNSPHVFLGEHRLLYEGPLDELEWHQHSFACVLVGVDGDIEIEGRPDLAPRKARIVLAGPALEHRLRFDATCVLTCYVPAHDPDFASMRWAQGGIGTADWDERWDSAAQKWRRDRDAREFEACIAGEFCDAECRALDHRVLRILRRLWRGEGLRDGTRDTAEVVGLSASRLSHLTKEHTGSTLGQLQRGYRLWHAARALLNVETFTEASYAAEFADSAHLSRAFRRAYGLPPSEILLKQTRWERSASLT